MGSDAHIRIVGAPLGLLVDLDRRLSELEQRWSRFVEDSEVSTLNRRCGEAVYVSGETQMLVATAVRAWRLTSGAFDPTVLAAMMANGYDRDFALVDRPNGPAAAAVGCGGIVVDESVGTVMLGAGVGFDPGGIGKGLAADLLVEEALAAGVDGVMVNIGGDIRVEGVCDDGHDGWMVRLDEPGGTQGVDISLMAGAITTSSTLRRRWGASNEFHHLVDPALGCPIGNGLRSVTVVADRGWVAEAVAKALHVDWVCASDAGMGELLAATYAAALVVDREGRCHALGGMENYLR